MVNTELPKNWYQNKVSVYNNMSEGGRFIRRLLETNSTGILIGDSCDTAIFIPWISIGVVCLYIKEAE